jgi:hypothetical protein
MNIGVLRQLAKLIHQNLRAFALQVRIVGYLFGNFNVLSNSFHFNLLQIFSYLAKSMGNTRDPMIRGLTQFCGYGATNGSTDLIQMH